MDRVGPGANMAGSREGTGNDLETDRFPFEAFSMPSIMNATKSGPWKSSFGSWKDEAVGLDKQETIDEEGIAGHLDQLMEPSGFLKVHILAHYGLYTYMKVLLSKKRQQKTLVQKDATGMKPADRAVLMGHIDTLKLIIDIATRNTDMKEIFSEYFNSDILHMLAVHGKAEALKYVLNYANRSVIESISNGYSVFHCAAAAGHLDCFRVLEAKMNEIYPYGSHLPFITVDSQGDTPIFLAAKCKHTHLLKYFSDSGRDLRLPGVNGLKLVHIAIQANDLESFKFLLSLYDKITSVDGNQYSLIHRAALFGANDCIQHIIRTGIPPDTINPSTKTTPLQRALMNGNIETARILMSFGANINYMDDQKRTVIFYLAGSNRYDEIRFVIENGGRISDQDEHGFSPLHYAAKNGSSEMVKFMLSLRADPMLHDAQRTIPLHWAIYSGSYETVESLLSLANLSSQSSSSFDLSSSLLMSISNKSDGNSIRSEILSGDNYLKEARLSDKVSSKKHVNELNRAMLNFRDSEGCSPFLWGSLRGKLKIMELLYTAGADVNDCDGRSMSVLMHSILNGHVEICRFLIDRNADIYCKDFDGWTALHYACVYNQPTVVSLILKKITVEPGTNSIPVEGEGTVERSNQETEGRTVPKESLKEGQPGKTEKIIDIVTLGGRQGISAAHCASAKGNLLCLEVLEHLSPTILTAADQLRRTCLHWACISGSLVTVSHLLTEGGALDTKDQLQRTPIMLATAYGHKSLVHFLLDYIEGKTPRLFPESSIPTMADQNGLTMLHHAAFANMDDAILRIGKLTVNPDYDAKTTGPTKHLVVGSTPLHAAAVNGSVNATICLLKLGANPQITDSTKTTPFQIALKGENVGYLVGVISSLHQERRSRSGYEGSKRAHKSVWEIEQSKPNSRLHGSLRDADHDSDSDEELFVYTKESVVKKWSKNIFILISLDRVVSQTSGKEVPGDKSGWSLRIGLDKIKVRRQEKTFDKINFGEYYPKVFLPTNHDTKNGTDQKASFFLHFNRDKAYQVFFVSHTHRNIVLNVLDALDIDIQEVEARHDYGSPKKGDSRHGEHTTESIGEGHPFPSDSSDDSGKGTTTGHIAKPSPARERLDNSTQDVNNDGDRSRSKSSNPRLSISSTASSSTSDSKAGSKRGSFSFSRPFSLSMGSKVSVPPPQNFSNIEEPVHNPNPKVIEANTPGVIGSDDSSTYMSEFICYVQGNRKKERKLLIIDQMRLKLRKAGRTKSKATLDQVQMTVDPVKPKRFRLKINQDEYELETRSVDELLVLKRLLVDLGGRSLYYNAASPPVSPNARPLPSTAQQPTDQTKPPSNKAKSWQLSSKEVRTGMDKIGRFQSLYDKTDEIGITHPESDGVGDANVKTSKD